MIVKASACRTFDRLSTQNNTLTERRYDAASVERHNWTKIVDKLAATARSVTFITRIQRPERTQLDNTTAAAIS